MSRLGTLVQMSHLTWSATRSEAQCRRVVEAGRCVGSQTWPTDRLPVRPTAPPPRSACDEVVYPVAVEVGHELVIRQQIYRGKIVDFSIQQRTLDDGRWYDVARIDCCHSTVHRHQTYRTVTGRNDIEVIREIPSEGRAVVNEAFTTAMDVMEDEWEGNLRRWSGG